MYTKDLAFLLRLLGTSKQSGMLFVEPPGPQEPAWQGQFRLDTGVVIACVVRNRADGRVLLSNDQAIRWITNQGRLSWHLEENAQFPDSSHPVVPVQEDTKSDQPYNERALLPASWKNRLRGIPRRTQEARDLPADMFVSREQRQVFALVDGRRTIEEIVYLLHKPPDSIIRALQELQAAGVIA